MDKLTVWDHVFSVAVFLIYPAYTTFTFKRVVHAICARGESARINAYKSTIAIWLVFASAVVLIWFAHNRDWAQLGIRFTDKFSLLTGSIAAGFAIALFVIPLRNLSLTPDGIDKLLNNIDGLAMLMPHSKAEESWFNYVSINAGLTEELVFRGYLMWYAGHFLSPMWTAVVAIIWFGIAHLYQGLKQLPGILIVSTIAVALYVFTKSLVVPIFFHILLNAFQGRYLAKTFRAKPAETAIDSF